MCLPGSHTTEGVCPPGSAETVFHLRATLFGSTLAAAMVTPTTTILPYVGRQADLPGSNGGKPQRNGKRPRRQRSLPVHRSILAVDIEGSTQRTNPVKGELRSEVYRLVVEALCVTGIDSRHYDPFTDRGDGVLVLLRPADELPKPLLLSRLIPALAALLAAYNRSISPADEPRMLRLRAVIHAGEVHYDGKGFFGEDLDVAFRLLDAPRFKDRLKSATVPLALVASDYIYQSIIRHGYDGIDDSDFFPLVTVKVGDQRRKGWVHLPSAGRISAVPTLPQAS
jgi:class 3 adenylate cyclase